MEPLHLAHLVLVAFWGGVVAAEFVVELVLSARDAAEAHYFIDLFVEGPLLLAILATGGVLTFRAWPLSTLHLAKVISALIAVGVNGWCLVMVIARRRQANQPEALERYTRRVRWAAAGVPFGVAAAWIGVGYFI